MTIVDVFETDNQGKLLSYCPTFDNRAIHKTTQTAETIRKSTSRLLTVLHQAQKSKLAGLVMKQATYVRQRLEQAVHNYQSPSRNSDERNNKGKLLMHVDDEELEKHEV